MLSQQHPTWRNTWAGKNTGNRFTSARKYAFIVHLRALFRDKQKSLFGNIPRRKSHVIKMTTMLTMAMVMVMMMIMIMMMMMMMVMMMRRMIKRKFSSLKCQQYIIYETVKEVIEEKYRKWNIKHRPGIAWGKYPSLSGPHKHKQSTYLTMPQTSDSRKLPHCSLLINHISSEMPPRFIASHECQQRYQTGPVIGACILDHWVPFH